MRVSALLAVLSVGLLVACGPEADPRPPTGLSDVTLIWPLPASDGAFADDTWLFAPSTGASGPVLPRGVFDHIPELTRVDEPDLLYRQLLVVAARLDPCFREGAGEPPCQPNLRLVMQPVVVTSSGMEARDASVHVFFSANDEDEILRATESLSRARAGRVGPAGARLDVHPLLTDIEGRRQVRSVLAPLLSADRLSRVTSVSVHGDNGAWTFSGFDWKGDAPVPIVIAELGGGTSQHLLSLPGDEPSASAEPQSSSGDDFSLLLDGASAKTATVEARQRAFDAAARVENPGIHNPGTIDCVSCHVSAVARAAGSKAGDLQPSPEAFSSTRHDLTPTANFDDPQMVRALGYRFGELVVSPRVIHESAAVADRVDALRLE